MALVGFDKTKSYLDNLFQANKLPHAILLCGKKNIGKKSFALEFALQKLESDNENHPDLLIVEKDEGKRDLNIEKIRKISSFLTKSSAISKNRFIIIDAADDLNRSSSNALLKTLEEPSDNCYIILICHIFSKILPTIKSRCQIVRIGDLNYDDFKKALEEIRPNALPKLKEEEIVLLSEICDFSPGRANKYGDDMIFLYEEILNSIENSQIKAELTKKISDKSFDYDIFIAVIQFFFLRLTKFYSGQIDSFLLDEKSVFQELYGRVKIEKIFDIYENSENLIRKTKSLNLDKKVSLINVLSALF